MNYVNAVKMKERYLIPKILMVIACIPSTILIFEYIDTFHRHLINLLPILLFAVFLFVYVGKNDKMLLIPSGAGLLLALWKSIETIGYPSYFLMHSAPEIFYYLILTLSVLKIIKKYTASYILSCAMIGLSFISDVIFSINDMLGHLPASRIFEIILYRTDYIIMYIALTMILYHQTDRKKTENNAPVNIPELISLTVVTFGIYAYVWAYQTIKKIRILSKNHNENVVGELLCFIFVPFYSLYWFYTRTQEVYRYATDNRIIIQNNSVINLVLALFGLNIISMALLQKDLNTIVMAPDTQTTSPVQINNSTEQTRISNHLRELAQLKEDGILTEEEFTTKKKELLDKI